MASTVTTVEPPSPSRPRRSSWPTPWWWPARSTRAQSSVGRSVRRLPAPRCSAPLWSVVQSCGATVVGATGAGVAVVAGAAIVVVRRGALGEGDEELAARCVGGDVVERRGRLRSGSEHEHLGGGVLVARGGADPRQLGAVGAALHGGEREQAADEVGHRELDREGAGHVRRQAAAGPLQHRVAGAVRCRRRRPALDGPGLGAGDGRLDPHGHRGRVAAPVLGLERHGRRRPGGHGDGAGLGVGRDRCRRAERACRSPRPAPPSTVASSWPVDHLSSRHPVSLPGTISSTSPGALQAGGKAVPHRDGS